MPARSKNPVPFHGAVTPKSFAPNCCRGINLQGVFVNIVYLASNLLALANNALVFGANLNNLGSARV